MKLIFLFLFLSFTCQAQNISDMQGIWSNIYNEAQDQKNYSIKRGHYSLNIVFNSSETDEDFPLWINYFGFVEEEVSDDINISSLKSEGNNYITVDQNDITEEGEIEYFNLYQPEFLECDGNNLSISGNEVSEYIKMDVLPKKVFSMIYHRGLKDNQDYLYDFLNIKTTSLNNKTNIYNEPNGSRVTTLASKEIVILESRTNDWSKVTFYNHENTCVSGWMKTNLLN